jgi:hypothetical protein
MKANAIAAALYEKVQTRGDTNSLSRLRSERSSLKLRLAGRAPEKHDLRNFVASHFASKLND